MYLASQPDLDQLSAIEGNKMLSATDLTQAEIDVLDVPTVRANYRALYATIMTNGSETWKALAYLNALKEKLSAFDFRIRFNSDHLPIGIVWMTHEMKRHLLQYGNIIFLDAQKREYNKLCWPYIAPVIRTSENKIRVIAESVVINEDLDTYQWILESIAEMEPKWSILHLRYCILRKLQGMLHFELRTYFLI